MKLLTITTCAMFMTLAACNNSANTNAAAADTASKSADTSATAASTLHLLQPLILLPCKKTGRHI